MNINSLTLSSRHTWCSRLIHASQTATTPRTLTIWRCLPPCRVFQTYTRRTNSYNNPMNINSLTLSSRHAGCSTLTHATQGTTTTPWTLTLWRCPPPCRVFQTYIRRTNSYNNPMNINSLTLSSRHAGCSRLTHAAQTATTTPWTLTLWRSPPPCRVFHTYTRNYNNPMNINSLTLSSRHAGCSTLKHAAQRATTTPWTLTLWRSPPPCRVFHTYTRNYNNPMNINSLTLSPAMQGVPHLHTPHKELQQPHEH